MAIPANDPNAVQYNKDLAQFQNDTWMMNPSNPNSYPAIWINLMVQLNGLHGSEKAVEKAMQIIEFVLLGPIIIDGYEQTYSKVKGDLMKLTSDVGTMENQVSSAFTGSKTGQVNLSQFNNAMKDLYNVFLSQSHAGFSKSPSQWLSLNDANNGGSYIEGLYKAISLNPGDNITQGAVNKMESWWKVPTKNPSVPNPNLKIFQDNLQSLSGINNSVNQASTTEESLNNNSQTSMEAILNGIYKAIITFETLCNQAFSQASN